MTYWNNKSGDAVHLRLFIPGEGWKLYDDQTDAAGNTIVGSRRLIERAFLNAMNASNLLIFTGCGSSFVAKNPTVVPAPTIPSC